MHRAITILRRAVGDILDNPVAALQVSVVPLLLAGLVGQHWLERAVLMNRGFLLVPGRFVWWMWALGLFFSIVPLLWMAVGWHRFVLLGERPWPVAPRLLPGSIARYGWRTFVVTLAAAASAFVGVLVLAILIGIFLVMTGAGKPPSGTRDMAFTVIGTFLFAYAFLFFSFTLVAAACSRRVTFREAIRQGDRNTVAIFWLTLGLLGITWALEAVKSLTHAQGIFLGGYELASAWFLAMLNIGILTALVGQAEAEMQVAAPPLEVTPDAEA